MSPWDLKSSPTFYDFFQHDVETSGDVAFDEGHDSNSSATDFNETPATSVGASVPKPSDNFTVRSDGVNATLSAEPETPFNASPDFSFGPPYAPHPYPGSDLFGNPDPPMFWDSSHRRSVSEPPGTLVLPQEPFPSDGSQNLQKIVFQRPIFPQQPLNPVFSRGKLVITDPETPPPVKRSRLVAPRSKFSHPYQSAPKREIHHARRHPLGPAYLRSTRPPTSVPAGMLHGEHGQNYQSQPLSSYVSSRVCTPEPEIMHRGFDGNPGSARNEPTTDLAIGSEVNRLVLSVSREELQSLISQAVEKAVSGLNLKGPDRESMDEVERADLENMEVDFKIESVAQKQ